MTPAPLGKVVGWSAAPWPSLEEIQSSSSLDGTTRPLKSHDHSGILIPAADYDRARVCVEAMEGVAKPMETMQRMRKTIQRLESLAHAAKQLECVDWIRPGTETDEQLLTELEYQRTLADADVVALLTLTGGRQ